LCPSEEELLARSVTKMPLPVVQHKRLFQLLSFAASLWNAIRLCQVAMNNKLAILTQL
jgi:hypothetical protein